MTKRVDGKPLCPGCRFCGDGHCRYAISTFYVDCDRITECPHFEEKLKKDGRKTEK